MNRAELSSVFRELTERIDLQLMDADLSESTIQDAQDSGLVSETTARKARRYRESRPTALAKARGRMQKH